LEDSPHDSLTETEPSSEVDLGLDSPSSVESIGDESWRKKNEERAPSATASRAGRGREWRRERLTSKRSSDQVEESEDRGEVSGVEHSKVLVRSEVDVGEVGVDCGREGKKVESVRVEAKSSKRKMAVETHWQAQIRR